MRTLAFDFDGTLTRQDTVRGFYRAIAPRRRRRWPGSARVVLTTALAKLGLSDADRVKRAGFEAFVRGRSREELERLARAFVATIPVHEAVVRRLDEALGRGDRVLVVSASFDVVVAAFRPAARTLATSIVWEGGRALGLGTHLLGARKVDALRAAGIDSLDEAWTDSAHDLPMLALARQRFRVHRDGSVQELTGVDPW